MNLPPTQASGHPCIANIINVLLNRSVNGHHPNTLDEFWTCWFQSPSFGHEQALRDICFEHGQARHCCLHRGDQNHDGVVVISDLNYLVNTLFRGSPAGPCSEEVDVNDDGKVVISDLTYLVNFLFKGGSVPPACPQLVPEHSFADEDFSQ